jgi:simple sugar transport system substrate-binding protein
VVDPEAFNGPIQQALDAGIPVVSYNADGAGIGTNPRLAYIGQDLFQSGVQVGERIIELMPDGGKVALFIATPGQLNIQPRLDGIVQALEDSGKDFQTNDIATGAELPEELSKVEAYYNGNKDVKGMFAVDGGSTQGVAQVMEKFGLAEQGVKAGGYDLLPETLKLMQAGHIDFTLDQQPYLQGFFPVVQLFLYKLSGQLNGVAETNTGLLFVTPDNVQRYLDNESRFEGDSEDQKVLGQEEG